MSILKLAGKYLATLLVASLCLYVADSMFWASPSRDHYLDRKEFVFNLAHSAEALLPELIKTNEVTWDPSFGAEIFKVVNNLKKTPLKKVLMLSSSSFFFVVGESTTEQLSPINLHSRLDQALKSYLPGYEVYNLSLGGMSLPEIEYVLLAATKKLDFDKIIIGVNPRLSFGGGIRNSVKKLSSLHSSQALSVDVAPENVTTRYSPGNLMSYLSKTISECLEENISFFKHKAAIRAWLYDVARFVEPPKISVANAKDLDLPSIQYSFKAEEQKVILKRIKKLFSTIDKVKSYSKKAKFTLLLNPVYQNPKKATFAPAKFVKRFKSETKALAGKHGVKWLDASSLLPNSSYGPDARGTSIHVLHYDARGHKALAEYLFKNL